MRLVFAYLYNGVSHDVSARVYAYYCASLQSPYRRGARLFGGALCMVTTLDGHDLGGCLRVRWVGSCLLLLFGFHLLDGTTQLYKLTTHVGKLFEYGLCTVVADA